MMNEAGRQAVTAELVNCDERDDFVRAAEMAIGRAGDVTVSLQDTDYIISNSPIATPEMAALARKYCREYLPHIHTIGITSMGHNAVPFSALEGIAANLRGWGYDCHFMEFSAASESSRARLDITAMIAKQGIKDSEAHAPAISFTATPESRQHTERITAKDIMQGIRQAMDNQRKASMPH